MFEDRWHLIQEHLERRGQPGCLVCDGTEWKVGNAHYADEARGGELVSVVCAECGYVIASRPTIYLGGYTSRKAGGFFGLAETGGARSLGSSREESRAPKEERYRLRAELEPERSKGFWARLFGG
jgi:hypothetical protein